MFAQTAEILLYDITMESLLLAKFDKIYTRAVDFVANTSLLPLTVMLGIVESLKDPLE